MTTQPERTFLLRSCKSDFTAHDGFVWPHQVGAVVHPSRWNPDAVCGDGLHGFINGEGDAGLADWSNDAQWIVFSEESEHVVKLGQDKAKARSGRIEHVGQGATGRDRLIDCLAHLERIGRCGPTAMGVMRSGGDGSTLTGGDGSTLTGGDGSTLTGGDRSTLTGGDRSTLTGGENSILIFRWWDRAKNCMRLATADADKLKPNTPYTVKDGQIVEVVKQES